MYIYIYVYKLQIYTCMQCNQLYTLDTYATRAGIGPTWTYHTMGRVHCSVSTRAASSCARPWAKALETIGDSMWLNQWHLGLANDLVWLGIFGMTMVEYLVYLILGVFLPTHAPTLETMFSLSLAIAIWKQCSVSSAFYLGWVTRLPRFQIIPNSMTFS